MADLRERVPAQSLMQRTLELHQASLYAPSGQTVSWYKGALGEIAVAGVLSMLGPAWTVLHSVPVGSGNTDIDHVVIGPSGVFTINTKCHPGQEIWVGGHGLFVSGQKRNYIDSANAEAMRAEKLLSAAAGLVVPVTGVVALVGPGKRTVKAPPEGGVLVVADWELVAALNGRRVFSDEQVNRIVAAAVRSETWHTGTVPSVDTRTLSIRFNAIVARVLHGAIEKPDAAAGSITAPAPVPAPASAPTSAPTSGPTSASAPSGTGGARQGANQPPMSGPSRPRPSRRRREALGKLVGIGVALWVFYGAIVPALQAALTP